MKTDLYNIQGEATGSQVDLPDKIFDAPLKEHTVYLAVKAHLANRRQGTHKSKTRSEVSGGGKKPWKQKGRGAARAGTTRSPLWVGGGRVFGPQPRDYSEKINKKARKAARRSVLTARLKDERLRVVEDFSLENGKTVEMKEIIAKLGLDNERILFLTAEYDMKLVRAARNIPMVQVLRADIASTYDLVKSKRIFIQKSAIARLEEVLG